MTEHNRKIALDRVAGGRKHQPRRAEAIINHCSGAWRHAPGPTQVLRTQTEAVEVVFCL